MSVRFDTGSICRNYRNGHCKYGNRCKFVHPNKYASTDTVTKVSDTFSQIDTIIANKKKECDAIEQDIKEMTTFWKMHINPNIDTFMQVQEIQKAINRKNAEINDIIRYHRELIKFSSAKEATENDRELLKIQISEFEKRVISFEKQVSDFNEEIAVRIAEFNKIRDNAISMANIPDIVKINVSGQVFIVRKSVFTRIEGTFFSVYFNGSFAEPMKIDDAYFIDRDPTHFRYIIKILSGNFTFRDFELGGAVMRAIITEMIFYGIPYEKIEIQTTRHHCSYDIYVNNTVVFKNIPAAVIHGI